MEDGKTKRMKAEQVRDALLGENNDPVTARSRALNELYSPEKLAQTVGFHEMTEMEQYDTGPMRAVWAAAVREQDVSHVNSLPVPSGFAARIKHALKRIRGILIRPLFAEQLRCLNDINNTLGHLCTFSEMTIRDGLKRTEEYNAAVSKMNENDTRIVNAFNHRLTNQESRIEELVRQLLRENAELRARLEHLERGMDPEGTEVLHGNEKTEESRSSDIHPDADVYGMIDYFDFEDHFRGSREHVREKQHQYVPILKGKGEIVDIGCGRGEFLEELSENGISARGVDYYAEYAEYCSVRGLNVVQDDGIHYLTGEKDDSLGGITALQVAEHLRTEQIIALCMLAFRKLKEGGILILETPNPTCLGTYAGSFYIDPSHVKPVHPKTLEYYARKAGFRKIRILYTDCSKSEDQLPEVKGSGLDNIDEINKAAGTLNELLFGSQDYALIAEK